MTLEQIPLGPAVVRWNDYRGTAAADDATALAGVPSLYEMADLDRERWLLVGIDLEVADGAPRVTVYAADRTERQLLTLEDLDELGQRDGGHIPVSAFRLAPTSRVEEFLDQAFQRIAIRLIAGPLHQHQLVVQDAASPAIPAPEPAGAELG